MNACCVKHLLTVVNAKEACALGERLFAKLGNLKDLRAGLELAVFFSVLNDILCNGGIDTRNVGEKRVGRSVDINANTVYTALNYSAESLGKSCLLHIVLILTNAYSLRLDLNKLCKGVLNSSCDRDSRSLHYVKVGELLGCHLGCRINAGACLGNNGIFYGLGTACITDNVFSDERLTLTGGGAVTDRNNVNVMLLNKAKNRSLRALNILSGLYGIDNRSVKHLTCLVNYSKLTAVSITGVIAKNGLTLKGCCKKKVTKVLAEYLERALAGIVKECGAHFPLNCGEQKSVVCVTNGFHKVGECGRLLVGDHSRNDLGNSVLLGQSYRNLKKLLLLTTVNSKNTVALKLLDRLGEVVVVLINAGLLGSTLGCERAVVHGKLTKHLSDLCVIGNILCNNVTCALQGCLYGGNCLVLLIGNNDKLLCIYGNFGVVGVTLLHNVVCKRLKSLVTGNRSSGLSLGSVGKINILKLYKSLCIVKCKGDLGGKLALGVDKI